MDVQFIKEYMNEYPSLDTMHCAHCDKDVPYYVEHDYERTREPNASHPEWFFHYKNGDIYPRKGFFVCAVLTTFYKCKICGRTIISK